MEATISRYFKAGGALNWRGGRSAVWQVAGVVIAWLYVAVLQMGNDGLWFQGDAPRHAANGLFWWDFLTSLPVNPIEFSLRYYARYPVINPASYPPVFYILEGTAFSVFGGPHQRPTNGIEDHMLSF